MNSFWYSLLTRVARLCGPWLFIVVSRIIAAGFFLFSGNVKESIRFYGALYPQQGKLRHLWYSFKQYQNFTTIHLDKFLAHQAKEVNSTSFGFEKLDSVIGSKGGILLMSHLGNWEMAATLLKQQKNDLKLLLYMGVKEKEGVERVQKDDLRKSGVTIIGTEKKDSSPFSALEGVRFLQSGGLVSMAGDIVWRDDQKTVPVLFLGHKAFLPAAPFIFSLVSGAPLFVFFAFRSGKNSYHFTLSDPIQIVSPTRRDRDEAITQAAQQYADLLETALRQHPFEWYHFDRFIQ